MSGGNGGGGGFFDEMVNFASGSGGGNFFENLGSDFLNVGLQSASLGTVGYENGKVSNGVNTNVAKNAGQATVSGVKEVTGAKAAEQANTMARQQYEQSKIDADAARVEAQNQTAKNQMAQSRAAGAARNATSSRSATKGAGVQSLTLGQDEKDFLGL